MSEQHPPQGPPPPPRPPSGASAFPPPQSYPPPGHAAPGGSGGGPAWASPGASAGSSGADRGHVLPLRPLTVGDILDGAFRLLRNRFGRVALLVVLVLGPFQLLTAFMFDRFIPGFGPGGMDTLDFGPQFSDEMAARMFGIGSFAGLVGMLTYLVVGGALVWMVLREDEGRPAELGPALGGGLRRLWATGAGTLLVGLAAMAGLVAIVLLSFLLGALFLPLGFLVGLPAGLLLMLAWMAATTLVIPVALAEPSRGAAASAGRALSLLRRRFWPIVGISALVLLMLMLVSFAISLAFGALALLAGPVAWVVDGISGTLVSVVTTPVTIFAALLIYLDARVRLEGLDLELRAQRSPRPW